MGYKIRGFCKKIPIFYTTKILAAITKSPKSIFQKIFLDMIELMSSVLSSNQVFYTIGETKKRNFSTIQSP